MIRDMLSDAVGALCLFAMLWGGPAMTLTYIIDGPPRPNAMDAPAGGLSGPDVIAKINWDDMPEQANARLIAAAPDLAAEVLRLTAERDALVAANAAMAAQLKGETE